MDKIGHFIKLLDKFEEAAIIKACSGGAVSYEVSTDKDYIDAKFILIGYFAVNFNGFIK